MPILPCSGINVSRRRLECALGAFLLALTSASADVLVGYDFDDGTAVATQVANITASHLTATDYDTGSGLISNVYTVFAPTDGLDAEGNAFGTTNVFSFGGPQSQFGFVDMNDADNLASAISANDYMTFTVTPDSSHRLNLASFTFRTYAKELNNAAERWALFSSVDGFASGDEITTGQTTDILVWNGTTNNIVVDLSDPKFQNLAAAIEFRLYVYGGNTSSNSATAFDKVILNGTVDNTILVGYDFDDAAVDPSEATVLASNVSAGPVTSPMGIAFVDTASDNTGLDAYGADLGSISSVGAVGIEVIDATRATFELAVDDDEYLSFTITPDTGSALHLAGISFKATKEAATSVDEYALTDATANMIGGSVAITNVVGLTGAYDGVVIDLSGTDYEYISEPTEFRIYAWGRGTSNTTNTLAALDKLTVHGSTFTLGPDYYVATNGDDLNDGSLALPFASIQHAVDLSQPGSTIYIRGGRYYEQIDLSGIAGFAGIPITLIPYDGETVTFDGTASIASSWTLDSGNVYKTTLTEDITQLFVDDQIMTLARFPNALVWSDEMWTARTNKQTGSTRGNVVGEAIVGDAGVSFQDCIGMFNFGNFETIISRVSAHTAGANNFSYAPSAGIYRTSDAYFFEGGVDNAERAMLDIAQEWAYDESTKTLYLWADDGLNPNGRTIAGKVQKFAITGDASTQNVVLDSLDFHATAFKFTSSDGITIQNCDLRYYTASDRALGSIETPESAQVTGTDVDFCEDLVVYNNTFRYSDDTALDCTFLENPRIENNHFQDVNYTCAISTGVRLAAAQNLILRRNSLINSGPFAGFRFGRHEASGYFPYIVEYNYAERCSLIQEDGTAFYSANGSVTGSIWRHNWAYDNHEIDYRFDGSNTPVVLGLEANIYRNVALATTSKQVNQIGGGYKLKGDYHEIYNNIAVQPRADFEVSIEKGGNANSLTHNNAGDKLLGADSGAAVPGIESNNYAAQNEPRRMLDILEDAYNLDFRPRADAVEFIDQGLSVAADVDGVMVDVTVNYNGLAPDIGAYEYGDNNYWIPGYQYPQASTPYPVDERLDAKYDTDLMWLGGLGSVSYNVYLGTASNSLVLEGNQTNNIYTPTALVNDQIYYWRIDSVLADTSVVTGDVWSFTVSDHDPRAHSSRVSLNEDSSVAIELTGTDPNSASLTYSVITQPSNGTLSGTIPNLVYTPNVNFFGTDSLVYTVNNGTSDSLRGIVMFDVAGTEEDPYFLLDTITAATASSASAYAGSIATTATDPDGTALSYSVVSGPSWLNIATDGTLSGSPQLEDFGVNSWTVQVTDITGRTATANLVIRVVEGTLQLLSFTDLGTALSANSLTVGGSSTGLTVTGVVDGNDYLYSVVYTGADYDGDLSNDTLTYDVRVKGWSGGTTDAGIDIPGSTLNASATIGSTDSVVSVTSSRFVVGSTFMDNGESLEFILENMAVSLTVADQIGIVRSAGFTSARMEQIANTANSHQVIFGEGTGLLGIDFNTDAESGTLNVGTGSLYISSDLGGGTRPTHWGVANVDYDLEVVVVPDGSYSNWAITYGLSDESPSNNTDGDGLSSLLEYAFGTNPNLNDGGTMAINGSSFTPGLPTVNVEFSPLRVKARFVRRVDHANFSIIYTAQFSNDLSIWEDLAGDTALRITGTTADVNGYEAVEMNYPEFLSNGHKAQFYRMNINNTDSEHTQPE